MTRARTAFLAVLMLLLAGCGLPAADGVQSAGEVRAEREEPPPLQVLPAGPQPGATPEDVVRGFLDAQISPEDDHAIARQFLAPGTPWDTTTGAVVYSTRRFEGDNDGDPLTFRMRFVTAARISPQGAFALRSGPETEDYVVAEQPTGEFRLVMVPPGLHLQSEDRPLSFTPYNVYFHPRGRAGTSGPLVPDRVFLPRTKAPAPALVEAVLRGPTAALSGAVQPALPFDAAGTAVTVADQVVTVDLPRQVLGLDRAARQRLAAQLAWTLVQTPFVGVRLRVDGEELEVSGAREVQTPRDWPEYDPAGLDPKAPLYYLQDRSLRALQVELPPSDATNGRIPLDDVAIAPRGDSVGLLTRREGGGLDEVRTGPIAGPFGSPVLRKPDLASLTWGAGDTGLWVLERGRRPIVWLLPPPDAEAQGPRQVTYEPPPDVGPLSAIRLSRDGARIALVFGTGPARRLFVGVVERDGETPRISTPVQVAPPGLSNVSDVAWGSGTSLVVLASSGAQPVVLTVTVDGSTAPAPVPRQVSNPVEVAAAPGRPTVITALDPGGLLRLYVDNGQILGRQAETGSRPSYPG